MIEKSLNVLHLKSDGRCFDQFSNIVKQHLSNFQLLEAALLRSRQEPNLKLQLSNPESLLSNHRSEATFCFCSTCVPLVDVQKDDLEIFDLDEGGKIQKKITPWKEMLGNESLVPQERKAAHPGLILVASLVDRPPNLVRIHFSPGPYPIRMAKVLLGDLRVVKLKSNSLQNALAESSRQTKKLPN